MTREEILAQYKVDANGVIRSPGKFEAEMLYAPYFWEKGLDGFVDEDVENVWFFVISADDRRQFPELEDNYGLMVEESDTGFLYVYRLHTEQLYKTTVAAIESEEYEDEE